MAVADLGVRVSLLDSASVGFTSLTGVLGVFGSSITRSKDLLKGLNATQIESGSIALGAGLLFAGFSAALKYTTDVGAELQDAMMRVSIAVDGADQNAQAMKDTVINLADYSVFSLSQVADSFVALGEKGQNAAAIMDGVGAAAINLAEATNSQTTPAAQLLASSLQVFGGTAKDAKQYADNLTFAFYNGIPSITGLQQAIDAAGGQASAMGVKFNEFVLVLDLLGQAGLSGTKAGTSLRYMLASLADPTSKAQKELADMGILVINQTAPAFQQLEARLRASGKAGSDVVGQFDGTLGALSKMFTEAQKLGLLHTDETLFQWAIKTGVLSDKLYDASGNFKGVQDAILQIGQAIDKLPPEQKMAALQQLFNVRGGQGATQLLKDLDNVQQKIKLLQDRERDTSASKDATQVTGTFSGTVKELGTTFQSAAEKIGQANLGPLSAVGQFLNNLVHAFVAAPNSVHLAVAVFLVVGTVLSGLVLILATAIFIFTTVGPVLGAIATIAAPVVGAIVLLGIVIGVLVANWGKIAPILKPVGDLFHQIGSFIQNTFVKAFNDTNGAMKTGQTVMPIIKDALHQIHTTFVSLGTTLHQAQPLWNALGVAIKVVVGLIAVSLAILFAVFMGLLHGGAYLVAGLIQAFAGLLQFIVGFVQFFIAIWNTYFAILQALFTGHADRIPKILINGMHQMQTALMNILNGLLRFVIGLLGGLGAFLVGAWLGFWLGLVSIVARMGAAVGINVGNVVQSIVKFFQDLPGKIFLAIAGLGKMLGDAGKNAMQMFLNGLMSMIGQLESTLANIAGTVKNFLGFHSPTKMGPLADSDQYMPNMMKMYASGIMQHKHLVHGAMNDVAAGMAVAAHVTGSGVRAAAASGAGSGGNGANQTPLQLVVDGKVMANVVLDHVTGELRQVGAGRLHR